MPILKFKKYIFIIVIAISIASPNLVNALPTLTQVKQDSTSSESLLLDRNGETIHRLRTNPKERRGDWVALEDISPALRTAMVLSED